MPLEFFFLAPDVESVVRPVFEKYYNTISQSPDGDTIRDTDWLGNAGFVRNIIEKARDHRNDRLDDADLDALLAQDDAITETQLLPFQQLIGEDLAEGVNAAVADAQAKREP